MSSRGRGRDIFPTTRESERALEAAARRRVQAETEAGVAWSGTEQEHAQILARIAQAFERRNETSARLEREAKIARELVIEASRAGVPATRIARTVGVSHQRILQMRAGAPEVQERARGLSALID